jgi:hypothetical protein
VGEHQVPLVGPHVGAPAFLLLTRSVVLQVLRVVVDAVQHCNLRCTYRHPGEVWRELHQPVEPRGIVKTCGLSVGGQIICPPAAN